MKDSLGRSMVIELDWRYTHNKLFWREIMKTLLVLAGLIGALTVNAHTHGHNHDDDKKTGDECQFVMPDGTVGFYHECEESENKVFWDQEIEFVKALSMGNIFGRKKLGAGQFIITIDDGPTPGVTDRMIHALNKKGMKATFFVVGRLLKNKKRREIVKLALESGHNVGNHTYNHNGMTKSRAQSKKEFKLAHDAIQKVREEAGLTTYEPLYFRAPGGAWKPWVTSYLHNIFPFSREYIGPIFWDVGGAVRRVGGKEYTADWACWSKKYRFSVQRCLNGYKREMADLAKKGRGGIVLLHDLKGNSAKLLEGLLNYIEEKGWEVVPMEEHID
jgi:peptidoglycan/xylan/chitin deacetylase (PgdA/CDA1 family)